MWVSSQRTLHTPSSLSAAFQALFVPLRLAILRDPQNERILPISSGGASVRIHSRMFFSAVLVFFVAATAAEAHREDGAAASTSMASGSGLNFLNAKEAVAASATAAWA